MIVYAGTYTKMGGPGIAVCSFRDGQLSLRHTVRAVDPGYLLLSRDRRKLYAVSKDRVEPGIAGACLIYETAGFNLCCTGQFSTGADGPCHVCSSPDERFLYTANYASGTISVFPMDPPGEKVQLVRHHGQGLHAERQLSAHVHHVSFIPGTDILVAVDLGMDALVKYRQNRETGLLTAWHIDYLPSGWGPRHLAYGQNGSICLVHELANALSVLAFDGSSFSVGQTVSTLPAGWTGHNTAAAVRILENDVWVSNRGHDSLARFHMLADGRLEPAGFYASGGSLPRDFFWIDRQTAIVANQDGSLAVLKWDHELQHMSVVSSMELAGAICVCPNVQP